MPCILTLARAVSKACDDGSVRVLTTTPTMQVLFCLADSGRLRLRVWLCADVPAALLELQAAVGGPLALATDDLQVRTTPVPCDTPSVCVDSRSLALCCLHA
jgi:hypothetical protein